jgi:hypothetical protein
MPSETHVCALSELQDWYFAQCDGEWEHRYGIEIINIDNPGWCLSIDLEKAYLADVPFPEYRENYDNETEWLTCNKSQGKWGGTGGPRQLERIIRIFLDWAQAAQSPEPE